MKIFIHASAVVVGIVNVVLFCFWLSVIRIDVLTPEKLTLTYRFDQISFQLAMLEMAGVFFALVLAALGFFGFQVLLERAETMANRTAISVVMSLDKEGRLGKSRRGTPAIPPNSVPDVNSVPTESAQTEEDI